MQMACFSYKIRRGENGKSRFLTFYDLFGYIGPFPPLPNFFGRTNHTNLTRRIDPRHPETPNSPIPPKMAFSFFRFLGFGPEGVHFPSFKGGRGSVFWDSGEGPLALSGESWLPGAGHFPRGGSAAARGGSAVASRWCSRRQFEEIPGTLIQDRQDPYR